MSILARLANMGDFFGLLLKIKPGDVMQIAEGVQTLADDDADLKERVLAGISVASILVDYTETEADDEFVEFVRDLTESDGVWAIVDAVRELLGGKKVGQLTIVADHPHGLTVGAQCAQLQPASNRHTLGVVDRRDAYHRAVRLDLGALHR